MCYVYKLKKEYSPINLNWFRLLSSIVIIHAICYLYLKYSQQYTDPKLHKPSTILIQEEEEEKNKEKYKRLTHI